MATNLFTSLTFATSAGIGPNICLMSDLSTQKSKHDKMPFIISCDLKFFSRIKILKPVKFCNSFVSARYNGSFETQENSFKVKYMKFSPPSEPFPWLLAFGILDLFKTLLQSNKIFVEHALHVARIQF